MSDHPLDPDRITKLVSTIFADGLHAKRVASLANAAVGVLEGAALGIHAIGRALAFHSGLDRTLKTNTVRHRTLSLLNQGLFHYAALQRMKTERAELLMAKFGEILRERASAKSSGSSENEGRIRLQTELLDVAPSRIPFTTLARS